MKKLLLFLFLIPTLLFSQTYDWSPFGSQILEESSSNPEFGDANAISDDGTVIVLGDQRAQDFNGDVTGHVRVFEYLTFDSISKFTKVLFIPSLAYFMEKDDYGYLCLIISLIPFLTLSTSLNIPNFFRHIYLKTPQKVRTSVISLLYISLVSSILHMFLFLIFNLKIEFYFVLLICFFQGIIMSYIFFLLGKNDKIRYVSEQLIINCTIYLLTFILFIFLRHEDQRDVNLLLLIYVITSFASFIYVLLKYFAGSSYSYKISIEQTKYLIKVNSPLIILFIFIIHSFTE